MARIFRKLAQLLDVDLTSTPPEDGDALVYDEGEAKWVPGAGGGGSDDQTAAEVPFTPAGTIASTDTQAAVEEVASDAATALSTHAADTTSVHGITDTSALALSANVPSNATFNDHSARHEDGGDDEISIQGLSGTPAALTTHEADTTSVHGIADTSALALSANVVANATFSDHSARHENGGADEISVSGLSGELADTQPTEASKVDSGAASDGDVLTADGAGGAAWEAVAGGGGVPDLQYESRSSNSILGVADKGKTIDITATITQTFEADETLGDGWWVILRNATTDGTTVVTLNPAGTETIDGLATVTMYSGETRLILCNGSGANFNSELLAGGFAKFTADGSFVLPHGATEVRVECVGAGGSGGGGQGQNVGAARNGGGGGGGGACVERTVQAAAIGAAGTSVAVTVPSGPSGGGGGTGGNGSGGTAGSPTSFGTHVVAYGGGAGAGGTNSQANHSGGGGGGFGAVGGNGASNTSSSGGSNPQAAGSAGWGGVGAGDNISGNVQFGEYGGGAGGHTFGNGGGNSLSGGSSLHGGAGGGAGGCLNNSGTERTGGAGGAIGYVASPAQGGGGAVGGGVGAPGSNGAGGAGGGAANSATGGVGGAGGAPGGGGGGGGASSSVGGAGGAGGRGECRVWYS